MRLVFDFDRALKQQGVVFTHPKELADAQGVSYSFSLLWRFGLISVPEGVERKLKGSILKRLFMAMCQIEQT